MLVDTEMSCDCASCHQRVLCVTGDMSAPAPLHCAARGGRVPADETHRGQPVLTFTGRPL